MKRARRSASRSTSYSQRSRRERRSSACMMENSNIRPRALQPPMSSRLATLAIALAAAGGALAQQSESTPIDARKIEGVSDLEVSARGAAEIRRGELTVFGEFLRYNREFGELEGTGGVRLQSGVDRFFGPTLEYNTLEDTGTFDAPGFLFQRERLARGNAERMEFLGPSHYRFFGARFTTCQPWQDDW